ncbi:16S rRNA (cytosine(1402)-N(4))-methyltransferase RsmH [soil metagenome]
MDAPDYSSPYHAPVMPTEVVTHLVTSRDGVYVDGTLGGGGHTMAILDTLSPRGHVVGIDRDPEARAAADARLGAAVKDGQLTVAAGTIADMQRLLEEAGIQTVDGVLLDLGVSSHQIDESTRGFAFSADGPLDMRMDPTRGSTAAQLANDLDESEIVDMLRSLGEEPRAKQIARALIAGRPVLRTRELADIVRSSVPNRDEVKTLARVFQAFRIAVNDELGELERALEAALDVLTPGGRLVVIAYHSLEDRRVKRFMRSGNFQGTLTRDLYGNTHSPWHAITRRAVTASEAEVARNPRSRSARLRVAEKLADSL